MTVLQSIIILGSLGVIAGIVLAVAFSRLRVEDDPLVDEILQALPDINCGACGYASCHAYAELVAEGKAPPDMCAPGGEETAEKIIRIKGGDLSSEKKIPKNAVVKCKPKERLFSSGYSGIKTCSAANISSAGLKCRFGCLGFGDCLEACPFDAIKINKSGVAEVVPEKCTACGLCIKSCPRNIIRMTDYHEGRAVYVGCSNMQEGKNTRKVCSYGCIACGLCVKRAPEGAFVLEDNLARFEKSDAEINVKEIKCPTGCIYESVEKTKS